MHATSQSRVFVALCVYNLSSSVLVWSGKSERLQREHMFQSIKFLRPPIVPPSASHLQRIMMSSNGNSVGGVRRVQAETGDVRNPNPPSTILEDHSRDLMSHSFGEGYSTRSDEEGFGGIYGGNDSDCVGSDDKVVHHPVYDKDQGCEVAEKEKARHQTTAGS